MSIRELTVEERRAVDELRARQEQDRKARLGCRQCGTEMLYVATLQEANGQGWGGEYLFQCPKCKTIDTRNRTV